MTSTHHHSFDQAPTETAPQLLKSYIIGFMISLVLTLTAFFMVQNHVLANTQDLYIAVAALAIMQLFALTIFFLRVNTRSEEARWHLISLLFTLLIMGIVITGSLWIMYNLNYNMAM